MNLRTVGWLQFRVLPHPLRTQKHSSRSTPKGKSQVVFLTVSGKALVGLRHIGMFVGGRSSLAAVPERIPAAQLGISCLVQTSLHAPNSPVLPHTVYGVSAHSVWYSGGGMGHTPLVGWNIPPQGVRPIPPHVPKMQRDN
jgi:hypothetical protein